MNILPTYQTTKPFAMTIKKYVLISFLQSSIFCICGKTLCKNLLRSCKFGTFLKAQFKGFSVTLKSRYKEIHVNMTAPYTVITPNFLVWKFYEKAQFP